MHVQNKIWNVWKKQKIKTGRQTLMVRYQLLLLYFLVQLAQIIPHNLRQNHPPPCKNIQLWHMPGLYALYSSLTFPSCSLSLSRLVLPRTYTYIFSQSSFPFLSTWPLLTTLLKIHATPIPPILSLGSISLLECPENFLRLSHKHDNIRFRTISFIFSCRNIDFTVQYLSGLN